MSQYGQIGLNIDLLNSGNANLWTPIYYLEIAPNSLIGSQALVRCSPIDSISCNFTQGGPTTGGKVLRGTPLNQMIRSPEQLVHAVCNTGAPPVLQLLDNIELIDSSLCLTLCEAL